VKLVETWVKAPFLEGASLLVVGECVQAVFPGVYDELAGGRVVLTSCPEAEGAGLALGKLASILACSRPREVVVLTVDGSPHCFGLHASLNTALFVTGSGVPSRHYVIVGGRAVEVSPESVRLGRYLHLVQRCIDRHREILEDLGRLSLEHRCLAKP